MATLQWTEDLSVGVKEIDEQHQEFIKIMGRFYDLIYKSNGQDDFTGLFAELSGYADKHFETEEKYFDEFHYELAEEHKAEHRDFFKKIEGLQENFQTDETGAKLELENFLEDWLVSHIGDQDKKYMKCFHEHGLH